MQVMSVSQQRACAVVDAGLKAVSLDSGPPVLLETPNIAAGLVSPPSGSSAGQGHKSGASSRSACDLPVMSFEGVEFQNGGDEHGKLLWPQVSADYRFWCQSQSHCRRLFGVLYRPHTDSQVLDLT